jgi:hypothetical protein
METSTPGGQSFRCAIFAFVVMYRRPVVSEEEEEEGEEESGIRSRGDSGAEGGVCVYVCRRVTLHYTQSHHTTLYIYIHATSTVPHYTTLLYLE